MSDMYPQYHGDPAVAAETDAADHADDVDQAAEPIDAAGTPDTVEPGPLNALDRGITLVDHARRELKLLGEFTAPDGDPAYAQSLIAAVAAFASYGHSGGSAMVGIDVLHRLLSGENLTPLTSDPGEWWNRTEVSNLPPGQWLWQNTRNSKAFSADRGATYWLVDETVEGTATTYYPTVDPGIPPFRQDPNPLPAPVGVFEPCTRMAAPDSNEVVPE